jgi:hypothetical protein
LNTFAADTFSLTTQEKGKRLFHANKQEDTLHLKTFLADAFSGTTLLKVYNGFCFEKVHGIGGYFPSHLISMNGLI